jgi:hypothetical protein
MLNQHDRAFKEWALVCEAMKQGRQTVLVRKGGIREDEGVFRVNDPEFFLLPTYEHQNPDLLQPEVAARMDELTAAGFDPRTVTIDAYAVVDTVVVADSEESVNALAGEYVWNADYVRMRFDFNPYDPLYVILLRVYRLPRAVTLPMRPEYGGCKSWVTLERPLSTAGALPAVADAEFAERRKAVLDLLRGEHLVSSAPAPGSGAP